jgi:3D (Asp-Asp-Asp) domain-containing protein
MESVSTLHIQLFKNVAGQVEILKNETQKCWGMVALFSKPGRLKPLGTFVVTAYSSSDCTPFSGKITSTLLPVGSGVAAVDPTLIPYGTVLFVPALKRYFFAYDTGSDVRKYGRQIDLFFDKGARVFGRRFLEIWVVDFSERS